MEDEHRNIIQTNYATLVKETDIGELLPSLVRRKVFSKEMISKYNNGLDDLNKKRRLFLDIPMRGPHAFKNLVAALHEINQGHLAILLDPNSNPLPAQIRRTAIPFMLPNNAGAEVEILRNIANAHPEVSAININTEPIRIVVKGSTVLYDDPTKIAVPIYSTHSKKRGIALIINIINYQNECHPARQGADVDGRMLKELFFQIGLDVEAHEDLTGEQIKKVITNFKSSDKLNGVDMVFVVVMGHGFYAGEGCVIPGVDNDCIYTAWIEEQFNNVLCKALQNRPKIMIYQTCRGPNKDRGVTQRIETDSASTVIRSKTDMLIAHSTLPGDTSHRDTFLGAWYIQKFCDTMMNHAYNIHIEDIFKMVDIQLSHLRSKDYTMQTSTYTNKAFKLCYLHPRIYVEDGVIKDIFTDIPIEHIA